MGRCCIGILFPYALVTTIPFRGPGLSALLGWRFRFRFGFESRGASEIDATNPMTKTSTTVSFHISIANGNTTMDADDCGFEGFVTGGSPKQ